MRRWLARHPRWTFHFTPTSASWLNAVERFFAKLTRRRLKRGIFRSLPELQAAINRFLADTSDNPNLSRSQARLPSLTSELDSGSGKRPDHRTQGLTLG